MQSTLNCKATARRLRVVRANAMGMCFGVRDALAQAAGIAHPDEVTIHGQLVHNRQVLVQLDRRGFRQTTEGDRRQIPTTPEVLVTAHGISEGHRQRLLGAGKRLIDTTCPLVRRVHEQAQALERAGYHILVLGRGGHVEVLGIVEDLSSYDVIGSADDVRAFPHRRLGIVCQTTIPPDTVRELCAEIALYNQLAEIRLVDTVCQPTRERQQALVALLGAVDAVVVVGGRNSNNTRQLVTLCHRHGRPALHVETAADLRPEWFADCHTVGLTAGTSTLDETIDEVQAALEQIQTIELEQGEAPAS